MAEPVTQFFCRFFDSAVGKIAILTMDNGHDYKKPNTLSESAMSSLRTALEKVSQEGDVQGLLITGKPHVFAAGADLNEIPFITTFDQGYAIGKLGHSIMKRIMDFPFPTLAAINGVALGGGLEIALYCDYRTIVRSVQAVGLPECFLGLIPGWGGCTLLTKLIGPERAIEIIVVNALNQNRMLSGSQAFEMGIADRLFDGAEFLDESLAFLMDIISGKVQVQRSAVETAGVEGLIEKTRAFVDGKVHGAAPAPYRALELIRGVCEWDVEKGFDEENRALGDLIKSRQCKASIYSFDLVNRYSKKPRGIPELKGRPVNKVGIIGAGLMASQLAQLCIHRLGVPVVMKDVGQEFVDKGCAYVRQEFARMAEKGRLTQAKARQLGGFLRGTLDYEDFSQCDFIIEAVYEEMEVKRRVFAEAEAFIRADAVLATNTSALSVTEMASGLKHPGRVVGFHFFNPVAVLPLVELIKAEKTDDLSLATAYDLSKKLKKTIILVKDSPAFLVNRILTRMLTDCLRLVDEGASFDQVDEALLSLGLPMAPFELLALVGPAVAYHVGETLNHSLGPERFPLSGNLKRLVEARLPGIYVSDNRGKRVDPVVEDLWIRAERRSFHPDEIRERVLHNLARETDLILKENVVSGSRDVDLAMIMGAGWPFFMGGLTMYLDLVDITPKVLQKVFFSS